MCWQEGRGGESLDETTLQPSHTQMGDDRVGKEQ